MKYVKSLINKAEEIGWSVDYKKDENYIMFENYSPTGQDIVIEIEVKGSLTLLKELENYYNNYDVSYEAYLWLDETGHGKNGAPYDMKDLYEDMEEVEEMIGDLYNTLNNYLNEIVDEEGADW